jgi:hypothetical protein
MLTDQGADDPCAANVAGCRDTAIALGSERAVRALLVVTTRGMRLALGIDRLCDLQRSLLQASFELLPVRG